MPVSAQEIRKAIGQVREILETLESRLAPPEGSAVLDPYMRRKQLLQRIYWNDNNLRRDELMDLLHEFGTNYAWIGQQVRKGYLVVLQAPGGTRYSVTQKAIRDEGLQEEDEEIDQIAALSTEAFAEDWNSEEDSAYDSL
ncbi:MAG: hypothetical protein AAB092_04225 [Chloroflexota bacterium]